MTKTGSSWPDHPLTTNHERRGGGWVLVDPLGFKPCGRQLTLSSVGSIPTHSRHFQALGVRRWALGTTHPTPNAPLDVRDGRCYNRAVGGPSIALRDDRLPSYH